MLGASQFVDVELFQFSGPDNFSSAQPLLRSFFRDLRPQVSPLPALVALKLISTLHVEELAQSLDGEGAVKERNDSQRTAATLYSGR